MRRLRLAILATIVAATPTVSQELCFQAPNGNPGILGVDCEVGVEFAEWQGYRTWGGPPCAGFGGPSIGCWPLRSGNAALAVTLSSSETDPWQSQGPLGSRSPYLYLWIICSWGGVESLDVDLVGTLSVLDFHPEPAFTNQGTPTELRLTATGCPGDLSGYPTLVGRLTIETALPAGAPSWGRVKAVYRLPSDDASKGP